MSGNSGAVWITGASSGIGRALALRLAADGRRVVASARRGEELNALAAIAPGAIAPWPLDITDRAAVQAALPAIEAQHGPVTLAVLNAGTHRPLSARNFNASTMRELVEINLMGAVNCLEAVLAVMRPRRAGQIAVVSSLAGYRGLPTAAAYGATKAALINMCEALKPECDTLGIKLQLVNTGFVRTPLTDLNPFPMPFLIELDAAVERIIAGLASDRFEIAFPHRFALILKLLRLLPYWLYFPIVKRTTRK